MYAGADLLVGLVVGLIPAGQFYAFAAAVRHHAPGARIAAVGDPRGLADGSLRAGLLRRLAVVAVARQGAADHHDEPGVGGDDDLVVRGVPIVLGPLGDGVVAGGYQGPSTMSTMSLRNRLRGWSTRDGPRWSMMRSTADFELLKSEASWLVVKFVRQ